MVLQYDPALVDAALKQIRSGASDVCASWAQDVQGAMRSGAPWTDRNGPSLTGLNARQSLECESGTLDNGDIQIIARSTRQSLSPWGEFPGAPIGAFLELGTRFMAPRPIINPTLEALTPSLKAQLSALFGGTE